MEQVLFSREETAEALRVSVRQIDFMVSRGEIRVRRIGRRVLIPRAEIERLTGTAVRAETAQAVKVL